MDSEQITFQQAAMQPIFERFKAVFAPGSTNTESIAQDVKWVVWIRMIYAFHPLVRPREIRLYFLKSFHPDTGTDVLSVAEKTSVTALAHVIFDDPESTP